MSCHCLEDIRLLVLLLKQDILRNQFVLLFYKLSAAHKLLLHLLHNPSCRTCTTWFQQAGVVFGLPWPYNSLPFWFSSLFSFVLLLIPFSFWRTPAEWDANRQRAPSEVFIRPFLQTTAWSRTEASRFTNGLNAHFYLSSHHHFWAWSWAPCRPSVTRQKAGCSALFLQEVFQPLYLAAAGSTQHEGTTSTTHGDRSMAHPPHQLPLFVQQ